MKKLISLLLLSIACFIIYNLCISIYSLWHKQDLVTKAKKQLVSIKREHHQLEEELKIVNSKTYVEKEARNKLFFVKPGERSVVLPTPLGPGQEEKKTISKEKQHWEEWFSLFF